MIYEDRRIDPLEEKAKKTIGKTYLSKDIDTSILQTIEYEYPGKKINVELSTTEFTSICPFSGLPDFANLTINYVPRAKLIELKSLKYYLYSYRNIKIYNEHVVNKVIEDLKKVLNPYEITITAEFTIRGGIKNKVTVHHKKK
ncbi:MAG: preQ(1) synthase [Candidatus Omnitrophica bacterium]|jgi:7-cyano-7-deazaguanine reductase|nr:preQ(1) synthase [Candidatus Omnitrophota bacterium]